MLPPAHYSAGLAAGLAITKATGSPGLGLFNAVLTHSLLDYLEDEYWNWQDGERVNMVILTSPLIITASILTYWLGWWALAWGLGGLAMDIIDTPLKWLTARMGIRLKNRSEAGIEIFPCHYYSPWYWGQAWPRMLSFYGTVVSEWLVSITAFLYIWLSNKA